MIKLSLYRRDITDEALSQHLCLRMCTAADQSDSIWSRTWFQGLVMTHLETANYKGWPWTGCGLTLVTMDKQASKERQMSVRW